MTWEPDAKEIYGVHGNHLCLCSSTYDGIYMVRIFAKFFRY